MDFTREPVIETVITPKEGSKLVIRSSKGNGQEEYFVDAVEVVTFGNSIFFRSLERPKPFLVPASDYEVLEVREARIVLKNVGLERSIKIGGGREAPLRTQKEPPEEKQEEILEVVPPSLPPAEALTGKVEARGERKRDRRRQSRKRRDRSDTPSGEDVPSNESPELEEKIILPPPDLIQGKAGLKRSEPRLDSGLEISEPAVASGSIFSNLFAPPPLISETIARYKEKFKDAFYTKEEQEARASLGNSEQNFSTTLENPSGVPLEQPAFGSFELSEEAEEEIYRQRHKRFPSEFDEESSDSQKEEEEEGDSEEGKLQEDDVQKVHKQEEPSN